MLDQYIWGSVQRISPEGPIPVLNVDREEFRLGGAANVAVNINCLDCVALPVGIVGKDHSGEKLLNIFEQHHISTEGIIISENFHTIVKQRAITDQQQLLRIDYEFQVENDAAIQKEIWKKTEELLNTVDCVVISDYAKGVLKKDLIAYIIRKAKERKIPIICDPGKGVDLAWYKGITAIKPNRFETEQATGIRLKDEESILTAANTLKKACGAEFVTISLDKDGILFFKNIKDYSFMESKVPEVYDVTGAGDMMISTVAVLLANKVTPLYSTYVANIAAGLETSHLGVVPIPWSEIMTQIVEDGFNKKIIKISDLISLLQRHNHSSLIFTNGYFDNISAGHLRFLLEINKIPGKLVVALNSDACIKRQKGSFPLLKELDRARLLASIENVHHIIIFEEDDASAIITQLSPDVVVKGAEFKGQDIPEMEAINKVGAKIEYIPHFSW
ncbi:hypothetical protein KJ966_15915 [bacterium]|nr:hypothetical protein [bacterium]